MRVGLATKISAAIIGVTVLAVASSLAALFSSKRIGTLMELTVKENLPAVRAAEELEIALLEQRGFVSSYILSGGDRQSLVELRDRKRGFDQWLAKARQTAHTAEEHQILAELRGVYQQYDAKRDDVVRLYDEGREKEATAVFLDEVNRLYDQAYELCEAFIQANERFVDAATARAYRQIRQVTWIAGICVGLSVGLGGVLLWLFFYGVLFPLRRMIAEARRFAGQRPPDADGRPMDEPRAVGVYLRTLMDDVAGTRSTLEESRSRLASAEKLATVGKLAAGVAHEMRNPLTAVKMWLFSIRSSVAGDPDLDRKLDVISEEINRLETIIRNFLEFSRPPTLKLGPQDLWQLIDKTLELFRYRIEGLGIRLVCRPAGGLPLVMADAEQLRQVLVNLLDNAAEAAGGGEIHVSACVQSDADGRRMVVVRVQDTGAGMSEEVRQRAFEPFFTTKDDGTGLGLCIAARIMARHDGRLLLESSTGEGTSFAVWIPTAGIVSDEQNPGS